MSLERPVQLIATGESGNEIIVNDEALKLIRAETRPITVLSIVGPARKGKSSILNLILNTRDGFQTSPTIEPQTKGIWMLIKDFPGDPDRCLIALDTEGLLDFKTGASHDFHLFTLTILMSSMVIYNTPGNIDSSATDILNLATRISSTHVSEDDEDDHFFPHFVWALRDFYLKLSVAGKDVTPDEYMKNCLRKYTSEQNGRTITALEVLKDFFSELACFTFPKPVEDENLEELEAIPFENYKQPFIDAIQCFQQFFEINAKTKTIRRSEITGFDYTNLINSLVASVKSNKLNFGSISDYVMQERLENEIRDLFEKLRHDLTEALTSLKKDNECNIEKFDGSFFMDIVREYEIQVFNQKPNWDVKSIQTLLCNDLQPSLIRMYKAREESVQFFRKVAEDLEVKAVSTKKKTIQVVGRAASIIGGGLAIASAGVAIGLTAGAAAPVAIPLAIAGASAGLAGGGVHAGGIMYGRMKLKESKEQFVEILKQDMDATENLKAMIEKVLKSREKERAMKQIPGDLSEIITNTSKKLASLIPTVVEVGRDSLNSAGAGVGVALASVADDVAVGAARTASLASKVLGSLSIALGGVFVIWDSVGIYRDVTAKSVATLMKEVADNAEATLSHH